MTLRHSDLYTVFSGLSAFAHQLPRLLAVKDDVWESKTVVIIVSESFFQVFVFFGRTTSARGAAGNEGKVNLDEKKPLVSGFEEFPCCVLLE